MTHLSGWCPSTPHSRGHQTCQERQDAGLLDPCDCTAHGGHRVNAPGPVHVEPDEPREVAS
jgi:hypothetical protein